MAQLNSIDFAAQRIYLHADTVTQGVDGFLLYDEIRSYIATTAAAQNYSLPIQKQGYLPKGGGNFTPKFVTMLSGWRIVPYDGVSHTLVILVELISADGLSDKDVFDRSSLIIEVDIDVGYDQVEIVEVNTGSGVSAQDITDIAEATRNLLLGTESFP